MLLLSWRVDQMPVREEIAATGHSAAAVVAALEALEKLAAVVVAADFDKCVHAFEIVPYHEKLAAVLVEKLAAADIHVEIAHALDASVPALDAPVHALDVSVPAQQIAVAAAVVAALAAVVAALVAAADALVAAALLVAAVWNELLLLLQVVPKRAPPVYRCVVIALSAAAAAAAYHTAAAAADTAYHTDVPPDPSKAMWTPSMASFAVDVVVGIAVDREHS